MKKKISVKCFNSKVYEMKRNNGKFIKNRMKTEQPMKELHHNNKIQKIVLMTKYGASGFFFLFSSNCCHRPL